VIEKRGMPKAVLLSIRDYVCLAAPEPEVLRVIGKNRSARAPTSLRHVRLTKKSRRRAPPSTSAHDRAPTGDRYEHCCFGSPQIGRLQRTVLLLAITKPARLYVSEAIMAEYGEVQARPKMKIRKGLRQQLLQLVKSHAHSVAPTASSR